MLLVWALAVLPIMMDRTLPLSRTCSLIPTRELAGDRFSHEFY